MLKSCSAVACACAARHCTGTLARLALCTALAMLSESRAPQLLEAHRCTQPAWRLNLPRRTCCHAAKYKPHACKIQAAKYDYRRQRMSPARLQLTADPRRAGLMRVCVQGLNMYPPGAPVWLYIARLASRTAAAASASFEQRVDSTSTLLWDLARAAVLLPSRGVLLTWATSCRHLLFSVDAAWTWFRAVPCALICWSGGGPVCATSATLCSC